MECRVKRFVRFLPIVMAAAATAPCAAVGQVQTYYRAGAWDAFSGRTENGGAVCGIGSANTGDNRRFSIRFNIGGTDTILSASKPDWSIPADTHVTVVMQVGLNTPWTMQAAGKDHSIDWTLDPNAMQTFDRQFRGSTSMTLTFPDGNEPPWAVSLAGSSMISDGFARCIRDLTRQVQAAQPAPTTSPASPGATQPFGPSGSPAPAAPPSPGR